MRLTPTISAVFLATAIVISAAGCAPKPTPTAPPAPTYAAPTDAPTVAPDVTVTATVAVMATEVITP